MKTRRQFFVELGAGLLVSPLLARASDSGKVYRIGFLGARFRSTPAHPDIYYDAWLSAMRDLGYVEGKNLVIEWRFAEDRLERLPDLAAELAAMKLEAIVTHAVPPTLALKRATSTTSIVCLAMNDPVGNGVVASLARPGGNITGLALMSEDVSAKRVELLKQLIPALSRIAVLINPGNPVHPPLLKKIDVAAKGLGVSVLKVDARNHDEIEQAVDTAARDHVEALLALDDPIFIGHSDQIAKSALNHHIASMAQGVEAVEGRGLIYYGMDVADCYRRGAVVVQKILNGEKPADLPIEQPTKIELIINRKTAKALGLTISPELLLLADKVIE